MEVFRSLSAYQKGKNTIATIGTFDGVHEGHKQILRNLVKSAKEVEGETLIVTFDPHPRLVLFPDDNPLRLLQTVDEKIETLKELGIDKVLIIPFNLQFSRTTSEDFIRKILVETIGISRIVIGYDHQFGKNREGTLNDLKEGAKEFGYEVEMIPAHEVDDAKVSSTKVRNALHDGDIQIARNYLGYTYRISGTVVEGEKLGRKIGYPTANVHPDSDLKLIPRNGVYFVQVECRDKFYYGMMNIGTKPTVGDYERGLEVNIFDFDEEIYGEKVTLYFKEWLREELKFDSVDELILAIDKDKEACLGLMAEIKPL